MNARAWIVSLFVVAAAPAAFGQQDKISFQSTQLAPGIVMLEGQGGFTGGNLLLWSGEDGTVLIDDSMPHLFKKMLGAIRKHTKDDIEFVINTHAHGDHIGNNAGLGKDGATIIAHENIRRRLLAEGVTGPDGQVPASKYDLPSVTFSDEVTLYLNGQTAHVMHVHEAHTDGDAIIHFPDLDLIHTGDAMFNGLFPYIDLESGGSVDGYIAAQERILGLAGKDTKIVPGHGPLATKADLEAARDMLVDARDRVRQLRRAGKSEDEIVALNPLADYHDKWNWGFITTEKMTRTLAKD